MLSMEQSERIHVVVVYALPDRQSIVKLAVAAGTTAAVAVEISGLKRRYPEITSRPLHCAIFGRPVEGSHVLAEGDRVEILRPLLIDPKENRRQTAARARAAGQKRR
jgi:putative ubiquitin-RnfH superfamily antitoxin RatB of RatAB toxin-antitoxin module